MIPYSGGTAQVLTDVIGGRVPLVIEAYSGMAGAIEAGTIRPLAVASPAAHAGLSRPADGRRNPAWLCGVGLAGHGRARRTPEPIVRKISDDLARPSPIPP